MTNSELYRAAFAVRAPEEAVQEAMDRASNLQSSEATGISQKRKPLRIALLPAILATMVLLMGAAGVSTIYNLLVGYGVVQDEHQFSVDFSTEDAPVAIEEGHLWFIADGQHIDITDITDEETPYIYTTVNPDTSRPSYIIVGGTPENFGYAEIWINQSVVGFAARCGEISMGMELTAEQLQQGLWESPVESTGSPWLSVAIKQLELELKQYLPDA